VDPAPDGSIDPRADRAVQSIIGVGLLAAFVFRMPWVLPVVALVTAAGALGGVERNPLHLGFRRLVAPRLPDEPSTPPIPALVVRRQDVLAAVVLTVASVLYAAGLHTIGWMFAIVEAVFASLAAATRIHVGDYVRRRGPS
jgi:hypothetical protein